MKTYVSVFFAVIVSVLPVFVCDAFSQNMSQLVLTEDTAFSTANVRELRLRVRNLNFFRNNEYKGNLVKGYTLPGLWLLPSVSYQPLKDLKIEAGVYMLRYWGENKYPNTHYADLPGYDTDDTQTSFHAVPFFRVHYAPLPGVSLVLGNIYGRNNHGLIEPLYNKEMVMTSDPEAGVQFLWDTRHFNLDMWVNWESFIFQGDKRQEEFTFGISSRLKTGNASSGTDNVFFYITSYGSNYTSSTREIYQISSHNNVYKYYAKVRISSEDMDTSNVIGYEYFEVTIDEENLTFSIEPISEVIYQDKIGEVESNG